MYFGFQSNNKLDNHFLNTKEMCFLKVPSKLNVSLFLSYSFNSLPHFIISNFGTAIIII